MSANLNAPALVGGQANPETTVNDAVGVLDAAVTETFVVDATLDVTLTSPQYRSAIRFSVTPVGAGGKALTLPAVKRLCYISNDDSADSLTITKGSTTVVLAHGVGGFFYTDGTTNGLVQLASSGGGGGGGTTEPFDLANFVPGVPIASQVFLRFNVVRAFTWPISLTGSVFSSGVAATASYTATIKQNGSSIGTLVWAIAGTVPTVTFSSAVTFAANDVITVVGAVTPDATLAAISLSFLGSRAPDTGLVPADMGVFIPNKPAAAGVVMRFNVMREFVWKSGLTGSVFTASTASAASKVFTIKKNGSSIGTITFATSATGSATFAADVFFAVNDVITIEAPTVQDTTLADVALNFFGSR